MCRIWWIAVVAAVVAAVSGVGYAQAATAGPCQPGGDRCLGRVEIRSGVTLPYFASFPLTGSPDPTGAVIVMHGTGRNAAHYFELTTKAASAYAGKAEIIAPWMQTSDDNPERSDAYWTNGDETSWKDGGDAVDQDKLSSYDAIDAILRILADKAKFPHLTKVTLLGHSAGAQFMQRYAAGARGLPSGLDIRFVVANPSSYAYLDKKRPASTSGCSHYNDYKYGLDHRNRYLSESTDQQIVRQYTSRSVTYLLGEKDTVQNGDMDDSCEANAQGKNRFERGKFYYAAIHQAYPSAPHELSTVPGVGHDNEAMINSSQGKAAIFRGW
ncbi:alpha/beta hydrolase [Fodinicola acaciae]|uniref:alpha/beta hydrolase n=1 Tax=Fodinicola acaciae TaxID=2681555 RepID=UPI0013D2AF29|nr:alpha/beta hydrolase [Fodinicola acaciae]